MKKYLTFVFCVMIATLGFSQDRIPVSPERTPIDLSTLHCSRSYLDESGQFSGKTDVFDQSDPIEIGEQPYKLSQVILSEDNKVVSQKLEVEPAHDFCDKYTYAEFASLWITEVGSLSSIIRIDFMDITGKLIYACDPNELQYNKKNLQFLSVDQTVVVVYRFEGGELCSYLLSSF